MDRNRHGSTDGRVTAGATLPGRPGGDAAGGRETPCPLCRGRGRRVVLRQPAYRIVRCRPCTNAWTEPAPGDVDYESANFHAEAAKQEQRVGVDLLPPWWRRMLRLQTRMLAGAVPPGSRVLDIGCGEGLLVELLQEAGLQVVGVEPSRTASERARAAGLEVVTGYFPHPDVPGPFAAVNVSHVMEHLPDPHGFLAAVAAVAAGGVVLFSQTNYRGLLPRIIGRRWYAWVPGEHFWHFTPRGLRRMLEGRGWRVLEVRYTSLVHWARERRWLANCASVMCPPLLDQFHMLVAAPRRRK